MIFSFFKNLLSNDKIVDAGKKAIDSFVFTDQEKSNAMLEFIRASMPMNVSRRFIAMSVTVFWLICGSIELGLILMASYKVEAVHAFNTVYVMPPFTVVVAFYFFKRMGKT